MSFEFDIVSVSPSLLILSHLSLFSPHMILIVYMSLGLNCFAFFKSLFINIKGRDHVLYLCVT